MSQFIDLVVPADPTNAGFVDALFKQFSLENCSSLLYCDADIAFVVLNTEYKFLSHFNLDGII